MEDSISEDPKAYRRRKKQLYSSIRDQMEFYFGDANLSKDRFLGSLIANDPWVDMSIFLKFNKIRSLTTSAEELAKALKKSTVLQVSEDGTKVSRVTPLRKKDNEEECTIYVERLPEDTEHDWLKKAFSKFGSVDYVSLPRYKHNRRIKGFCFIEFASPESAQKALEYFEAAGCKLPSQIPPDNLLSIATFEKNENEHGNVAEEKELETKIAEKPKEEEKEKRKRKVDAVEEAKEEDGETEKKKAKIDAVEAVEPKEKSEQGEEEEEEVLEEDESKNKRKRKKKKKNPDELKQLGLQVLSKRDWRQLRNKYLNMQRQKMTTLKEHLKRSRSYGEKEVEEHEQPARFQFSSGLIVHLHLSEICKEAKKMKADIRSSPGVEFVELDVGSNTGYVRFSTAEDATRFCESGVLEASMYVLQGDEEKEYWYKMRRDRERRLHEERSKKQLRGREKLLRRAERELGKHIRFD